jgi:hypothetical protein
MRKIQFGETIQKRRGASRPGGKAAAAFLCQLALSGLAFNATAEPSVYPTGVTRYDPAKAFNSYVLFSGADKITRLTRSRASSTLTAMLCMTGSMRDFRALLSILPSLVATAGMSS